MSTPSYIYAVLLVLAAGAAWLLWRLVSRPRRLEIGPRGILDRGLRLGWIHWDEIEGAWQPSARDRHSLALRVRVSRRLSRRIRRRLIRIPGPLPRSVEVRLDLAGGDWTSVEILQHILVDPGRAVGAGGAPCDPVSGT